MSQNNTSTFEDNTISSSRNTGHQVPTDANLHSRTETTESIAFLVGSLNIRNIFQILQFNLQ